MTKLNVVVSLITKDNDYQMEQAAATEEAARRLDVDIQITYADNDAVNQSQQLVKVVPNYDPTPGRNSSRTGWHRNASSGGGRLRRRCRLGSIES